VPSVRLQSLLRLVGEALFLAYLPSFSSSCSSFALLRSIVVKQGIFRFAFVEPGDGGPPGYPGYHIHNFSVDFLKVSTLRTCQLYTAKKHLMTRTWQRNAIRAKDDDHGCATVLAWCTSVCTGSVCETRGQALNPSILLRQNNQHVCSESSDSVRGYRVILRDVRAAGATRRHRLLLAGGQNFGTRRMEVIKTRAAVHCTCELYNGCDDW